MGLSGHSNTHRQVPGPGPAKNPDPYYCTSNVVYLSALQYGVFGAGCNNPSLAEKFASTHRKLKESCGFRPKERFSLVVAPLRTSKMQGA